MFALKRYRRDDTLILTTQDNGRWVHASGSAFPLCDDSADGRLPRPHDGAVFFRSDLNAFYFWTEATVEWTIIGSSPTISRQVGITIDGGGSAITTGVKGFITVPFGGTIAGWTLLGDQAGSIVIDVWKAAYADYPPTVADTIAGTEKPTLAAAAKGQDNTLTTWDTEVTAGDVFGFNVDSVDTVTRVTLSITVTES